MFRIILRMRVRPGMEREFERTWLDGGPMITGQPANRGQWLARSLDEQNLYYIISDWADEPRFREYERSEAHRLHRERLHPYRLDGDMA